jgi:hypothetical protein
VGAVPKRSDAWVTPIFAPVSTHHHLMVRTWAGWNAVGLELRHFHTVVSKPPPTTGPWRVNDLLRKKSICLCLDGAGRRYLAVLRLTKVSRYFELGRSVKPP